MFAPEGTRIEAADDLAKRIENQLTAEPLVRNYSTFLGKSAPRFYYNVNPQQPATNYAQILVNTRQVGGHGVRTKTWPLLFLRHGRAFLPVISPEQKELIRLDPPSGFVFVHDPIYFSTKGTERVIFVHGVVFAHHDSADRAAISPIPGHVTI